MKSYEFDIILGIICFYILRYIEETAKNDEE
jgi:hypothetical protein